jgi:hypothetical protein
MGVLQSPEASEQAMRRFKKKLAPEYITPVHVVPCGTYGNPGITLRTSPPDNGPDNRPH